MINAIPTAPPSTPEDKSRKTMESTNGKNNPFTGGNEGGGDYKDTERQRTPQLIMDLGI